MYVSMHGSPSLSPSLCVYMLATLERFYFLTAYQDIKGSVHVLFLYLHIHILFFNLIITFLSNTKSPDP